MRILNYHEIIDYMDDLITSILVKTPKTAEPIYMRYEGVSSLNWKTIRVSDHPVRCNANSNNISQIKNRMEMAHIPCKP